MTTMTRQEKSNIVHNAILNQCGDEFPEFALIEFDRPVDSIREAIKAFIGPHVIVSVSDAKDILHELRINDPAVYLHKSTGIKFNFWDPHTFCYLVATIIEL